MTEYAIRPWRPGDERGLVDLLGRSFGSGVTEDHWKWKLRGRTAAVDNVWLAESAEGFPVFHYAAIPNRFSMSGRPVTAMTAVDAVTAPEYRRRGLLTRALPQIHSAWRESGVPFVLGLPNEQWGSRARALGWQRLFPLQWLTRPLRPSVLLSRSLKLPFLERSTADRLWNHLLQAGLRRDASVRVEPVSIADEAFDRLWERCRDDAQFSTVRDRSWIEWRFLGCPSRSYRLSLARRAGEPAGYCVHYVIETQGRKLAVLAEILTARGDRGARDTLLHHLIGLLLPTGAEALTTLAIPGTAQHRWLRRAAFVQRQAFSVELVPLRDDVPFATMRRCESWNLSGADFDVV
jgi:Acetyltransferase (GNAT) domain